MAKNILTMITGAETDRGWSSSSALESYTSAEPLPWSDLFIARCRALAAFGRGERGRGVMTELQATYEQLEAIGHKLSMTSVARALAAA